MVKRLLERKLSERFSDSKALIITGPRQSGKTTLVRLFVDQRKEPCLWWTGDDFEVRSMLSNITVARLKSIIGNNHVLVIDEAQRIENIGLCIKMIVDNIPDVKVIATGSSAFELANRINEPLTGRKWEYLLAPFSFKEMADAEGLLHEKSMLHHRLVFGYYPEVVMNPGNERSVLKQLADSYLYKDILVWENIHKPERMERLIQALALQIGNEVSFHELGKVTGLNNETVEKYIDLLEKAFVIFRLRSFSRNLRNELKRSRKIYFFDNGIRNAVVNAFNPIDLRDDKGALWENFMISERMKVNAYNETFVNRYFWRTHAQQEIDYIEEHDSKLQAFEFKWNSRSRVLKHHVFLKAYPQSEIQTIGPENFFAFAGIPE
ncbi:MAG: ATP-binding protein [Bacteroidetes bacterium]|nr:ATP-binding protein [Bacteroidota bacterium]